MSNIVEEVELGTVLDNLLFSRPSIPGSCWLTFLHRKLSENIEIFQLSQRQLTSSLRNYFSRCFPSSSSHINLVWHLILTHSDRKVCWVVRVLLSLFAFPSRSIDATLQQFHISPRRWLPPIACRHWLHLIAWWVEKVECVGNSFKVMAWWPSWVSTKHLVLNMSRVQNLTDFSNLNFNFNSHRTLCVCNLWQAWIFAFAALFLGLVHSQFNTQ